MSNSDIQLRRVSVPSVGRQSMEIGGNNTFSIDIGAGKPFKVRIRRALKFTLLADDENKVCLKVHYESSNPDVMTLKWSHIQRDCNSRDHITSKMGSSAIKVPEYKSKEVYNHNGIFISVTLRTYIPGTAMQKVLNVLTEDEIDAIQVQVEAIVWDLAKKTSEYFGHVQDSSLKTNSAAAYIRARSFLDKLSGKMYCVDWNEVGTDSYIGTAVFCHGSLSPEHIILDGSTVVGIIGWSNADFKPEVYDRLTYYFASSPTDALCWYRRMANVSSSPATLPPSVEFVVNTTEYVYKSMWANASLSKRFTLDKLFNAVRKNYTLVTCLSTAVEMECDTMSLTSLSNWTDSTWDKSAASTVVGKYDIGTELSR